LSPFRPHTTMAIENVKRAAREAQPRVINMKARGSTRRMLPRLRSSSAGVVMVVTQSVSTSPVQERQQVRQPYPNYRVIVLDDDVNTFQHVVECLVRHIPGMQPDRAWELAHRIDGEGSAVVWRGPLEQAELYHQLLGAEGLTMAPLEKE
jgi:ATP-dependent Clp protease adaptor protein ClpS